MFDAIKEDWRVAAEFVVDHIAQPEELEQTVQSEPGGPSGVLWDQYSLGSGYAGTALALLELGKLWDRDDLIEASFSHLRQAVRTYNSRPGQLGLFVGATGILVSLTECSMLEHRFRPSALRLRSQVNDQLLSTDWSFARDTPLRPGEFDLISGLSGILIALTSSAISDDQSQVAIDHVAHYLAWVFRTGGIPAFFQSPRSYAEGSANRVLHPNGLTDATLAHGLAGVLQALAMTHLLTPTTLDLREPIRLLIDAIHLAGSPIESYVPGSGALLKPQLSRSPVWCRGDTGVLIALSWGARAVGDDAVVTDSKARLEQATRHAGALNRHGTSLCHGLAGMVVASLSAEDRDAHSVLTKSLVQAFNPASAFGFTERSGTQTLNDPSLLSGAAGAALALGLAASNSKRAPGWLSTLFQAPNEVDFD